MNYTKSNPYACTIIEINSSSHENSKSHIQYTMDIKNFVRALLHK
jgi:hypothetical protein